MPKRNHKAEWRRTRTQAGRLRRALIARMGGECAECGATTDLTFHHPFGRPWKPSEHNARHRLRLYEADLAAGNLELLCNSCNSHDGAANAEKYREARKSFEGNNREPLSV